MRIYKYAGFLIVSILTILSLASLSCHAAAPSPFQEIDELLFEGENRQAWEALEKLSSESSGDDEVQWRMARTQYEIGRLSDSDAEALMHFQEAEKYSRAAMSTAPDKSEGYKWLAISLGAQSKLIDTKSQVEHSREIKENIEKAITLAPDDDISYLVLSRWHYKMAGLGFFARIFVKLIYGGVPEASLKQAEKLLIKAIDLHDRITHRYNLAKVYNRMDRQEEAIAQLQLALLIPVTFPEESEELEKSREKLEKWR